MQKKFCLLSIVFFSLLVFSFSFATAISKSGLRRVVRDALIDYLENPETSELSLEEVKDLLDFYLSVPKDAQDVDLSVIGKRAGKSMREIVGIIAPEYTREREEEEEKPAPKVQLYKRKCCMRGKYRTKSWPFFGTKKTYECEETYFTECSEDPVCTREVMVKTQIFWGPTITKRRTDSFYQNTEDYSSRRPEKDIKFQKYPC